MLSKQSQTEKSSCYLVPFIENARKSRQIYRDRKQLSNCLKPGEEMMGLIISGITHMLKFTWFYTLICNYISIILKLSKNKKMKEHFVCTFLLHCGEWAEGGKNGRKGRSEQTSDWWQMLLVAQACSELRER